MTTSIFIVGGVLYAHDIGFLNKAQLEGMQRQYRFKPTVQAVYDYLGKLFPNEYITIVNAEPHDDIFMITKESMKINDKVFG